MRAVGLWAYSGEVAGRTSTIPSACEHIERLRWKLARSRLWSVVRVQRSVSLCLSTRSFFAMEVSAKLIRIFVALVSFSSDAAIVTLVVVVVRKVSQGVADETYHIFYRLILICWIRSIVIIWSIFPWFNNNCILDFIQNNDVSRGNEWLCIWRGTNM